MKYLLFLILLISCSSNQFFKEEKTKTEYQKAKEVKVIEDERTNLNAEKFHYESLINRHRSSDSPGSETMIQLYEHKLDTIENRLNELDNPPEALRHPTKK